MSRSELSRKIQAGNGYVDMVKILVKDLKLPDPTKRKGLRQYVVNFSQHNQKINACYDAHRHPPHTDYTVLVAIVNLWAKLGVDSVLRDRLIASGMLGRMIPLLETGPPETRHSVLFALSNVTHHGGSQARRSIATLTTSTIVDLIAVPDCPARIAELGLAVLSHSLSSTVSDDIGRHIIGNEVKTPAVLKDIHEERLVSALGWIIRRPDVDEEAISHGIELLRSLAFVCRDPMFATKTHYPLIAALASPNIHVRLGGFMGIVRLGGSVVERESRMLNPMQVAQIARNPEKYFNPTLMNVLRNQYGGLKGGMIAEIAESAGSVDVAAQQLARDGDYAKLGRALCKRILECEYSLGNGVIMGPEGIMEGFDATFKRAGEALRITENPEDAYFPALLAIKMAMGQGDRDTVCGLSAQAIRQFPEIAFFHYTQATWTEESRTALRLAKKGLACSGMTDYVKRGLLFRSAEAAYEMAMSGPLEMAAPGSPAWREAVAILHCGQEDSKAYIEMTPMDQKNMKTMIYTYLGLSFILEGDAIYKNLDMVRPYIEKLSLAEQIYAIVVRPLPRTERKLAIDTIIPLFGKPLKNWRPAIARLDKTRHHHQHGHPSQDDPDHILASWLARTAMDDEDAPDSEFAELKAPEDAGPAPGTSAKDVFLYRCSLCGNPSASLKRCGRCKEARYCDDNCQRKHWKKGHKVTCKPSS